MTEALEKETENAELSMGLASKIFTIFIELAQNMMNYSKRMNKEGFDPKGLILVGKTKDGYYYVYAQNIVNKDDKDKIEKKLKKIIPLNKEEIKKLYREARKSGKDAHSKGGGIGFYEIAKKSEKIEYGFVDAGDEMYYFQFKAVIGKA
ncbi:hypothetical protein C3L23_05175 [Nautilia sp. PV-1]|nr:hypothetical protein C3L23_05175 [Nautilia sp. PV-1]